MPGSTSGVFRVTPGAGGLRRRPAGVAARVIALLVALGGALPAAAGVTGGPAPAQRLTPDMLARVFPGGGRAGAFTGDPPAAPVYRDGVLAGYVFSTRSAVGSVGYSGKPIDILVGLDMGGIVTGAYLRRHSEPILVIGIPEKRLAEYVAGFRGLDVRTRVTVEREKPRPPGIPDIITGASISSAVILEAVLRSARVVARSRGLLAKGETGVTLDRESFSEADWPTLMADGSIVRLRLTNGAVAAVLRDPGPADPAIDPAGLFIDLYAALITPPRVGQNLLGKRAYNRLFAGLGPEEHAIMVAATGLYSFKGTGWVRSGRFDRIELVQGGRTIRFVKGNHRNVEELHVPGVPALREIGIFVIPADTGFDPLAPWRLGLLVERKTAGGNLVRATFDLGYSLPAVYRRGADTIPHAEGATTLWRRMWRDSPVRIAVLVLILGVLSAVLVFQDVLVQSQPRYRAVRLGFLGVVLLWLGWYAGTQLSVVNVLTFIHSLLSGFQWELFLLDPLAFILWSYVAVAMLFWGRGVFCGWLCPFGALQELSNELARVLKVPQIDMPFLLHERLWPIKYVLFLGLFAVSLHSTNLAVMGAEVEPFKTVISLKFARHWPFVAYALGLLAAGLFIERFFCRYLCPLGAALAIPARLRMFDWLKRKYQCGRDCRICADRCTVKAIHPDGSINPNECIHCLNCQMLYYDEHICPPLVARRKRREARLARDRIREGVAEGA